MNRAVNSIPSRARIEIDVRDIDQPRRDAVLEKIAAACKEVAARRQVAIAASRSMPILPRNAPRP